MANESPAFRFYPRDFLADPAVQTMSATEAGAYLFILCAAWQGDRPGYIPNDDQLLAKIARLDRKRWAMCEGAIRRALKSTEDGDWLYSKRMVAEFEKQRAYRDHAVMAGKASAEARSRRSTAKTAKVNDRLSTPVGFGSNETPTQSNSAFASSSASAEEQEKKPEEAFDWESVYATYPRKEGKKKGLQRLRTQIKTREKFDAFVRAVGNYAASVVGKDQQYVKHFDTFVGCWEDYLDAAVISVRSPTRGPAPVSDFSGVESGVDIAHLLRKKA